MLAWSSFRRSHFVLLGTNPFCDETSGRREKQEVLENEIATNQKTYRSHKSEPWKRVNRSTSETKKLKITLLQKKNHGIFSR